MRPPLKGLFSGALVAVMLGVIGAPLGIEWTTTRLWQSGLVAALLLLAIDAGLSLCSLARRHFPGRREPRP